MIKELISTAVNVLQTHETNKISKNANEISKEANEIAKQANEIAMKATKPVLGFTGKLLWSEKDAVELYYEKTADMAHAMDVDGEMSELEDVAVLTVRIRNLGKEEINRIDFQQFAVWQGTLKAMDGSQDDAFGHPLFAEDTVTVDITVKEGEEKDINVILPLDQNWDDGELDEMRNSVEKDSVALCAAFEIFTVSGGRYKQTGVMAEYWRGDMQD